jgi:hypothetical protein
VLRSLLVVLIALASVGFVVGTTIERRNSGNESAAQRQSEGGAKKSAEGATGESGGESPGEHAAEGTTTTHAETGQDTHKELRPLGIDIEAVPFVILAALTSLALAAVGWRRPQWLPGLVVIAIAMLVFGALDVREVFHQSDESQTGLAILAGVIAALHFGAAAVATTMGARRDAGADTPGSASTMPA